MAALEASVAADKPLVQAPTLLERIRKRCPALGTGFSRERLDEIRRKSAPVGTLEQSADHKRFIQRIDGRVQLPEAKATLALIRGCTRMGDNYRRIPCRSPWCPTCGVKQKEKLAEARAKTIKEYQKVYSDDHCSAITVNGSPCRMNALVHTYKGFRRAVRNSVSRHGLGLLDGEVEIIMKEMMDANQVCEVIGDLATQSPCQLDRKQTIRALSRFWKSSPQLHVSKKLYDLRSKLVAGFFEKTRSNEYEPELVQFMDQEEVDFFDSPTVDSPVCSSWLEEGVRQDVGTRIITTTGRLMVHLHGFLIHPNHTREEVAAILEKTFTGDRAVWIKPIRDTKGRNGQMQDGVLTWSNYLGDKSSAVKGALRRECDPREQAFIFDAYAQISKGTRRRPRIRIGKLGCP